MLSGWDATEGAKLRFFKGLAAFYRTTGDLRRAFDFLAQEHASGPVGAAARGAAQAVAAGATLDEALGRTLDGIDPVEHGMLRVGERTGEVDAVLDALATRLESRRTARTALRRRLAYPLFIVHAAGAVLAFTAILGLTTWLTPLGYFALLYGIAGAVAITVRRLRASAEGARRLLGLPVVGGLAVDGARARFTSALALLYDAGVPLGEALDVTADTTAWAPIADEIRAAGRVVAGGQPLSTAIPPMLAHPVLVDAIRVGEATGTLGETLTRAGAHYRERVDRGRERLVTVLHAIVYGLAVAAVVYVVITVYGSYFAMLG